MVRFLVLLGPVLVVCVCLAGEGFPVYGQEEAPAVPDPFGDLENRFFEALAGGQAGQAEELLRAALDDGRLTGTDPLEANLLVALGNHFCEAGNVGSACFWLEGAVTRYGSFAMDDSGEQTYGSALGAKIAWLKSGGVRSWVEKEPAVLARRLFQALSHSDKKTLEGSLALFDIYLGWWQSELEPVTREELLAFLESHRGNTLSWANEPEVVAQGPKGDTVIYMNTRGWKDIEGYSNIQFALHPVAAGGWEWRGIVLGEDQTASSTP